MIDRYTLRYFLAVLDTGNFSRAAVQCHVSQPTLSVGIAKLERDLGADLFVRTNRRVELTVAGARFAVYARKVEADFVQAERSVRDVRTQKTIRLGILSTISTSWLESVVMELRSHNANERVEYVEGRERELLDKLSSGRIDAALTLIREDSDRFGAEAIFTEDYALAMSLDHPLAHLETITAEALADNVMIARRNCEVLAETSKHFTARGVRPFFAAKTTNDDRAMALVRSGLGITIMPSSFANPFIAMPRLSGFTPTRTIGFLFAAPLDNERVQNTSAYNVIKAEIARLSIQRPSSPPSLSA